MLYISHYTVDAQFAGQVQARKLNFEVEDGFSHGFCYETQTWRSELGVRSDCIAYLKRLSPNSIAAAAGESFSFFFGWAAGVSLFFRRRRLKPRHLQPVGTE